MRTLHAAALFAAVTATSAVPAAFTPAHAGAGIEGATATAGAARAANGGEQATDQIIKVRWSPDGTGHIEAPAREKTEPAPQSLNPQSLNNDEDSDDDSGDDNPKTRANREKAAPSPLADKGLTAEVTIPDDLSLTLDGIPGGQKALLCLAMNDYFEARGETLEGRMAVAKVVMNRTRDSRFPRTVCGVVTEKKATVAGGPKSCQFSWHCDGQSDVPANDDAWRDSLLLAAAVLFGGDAIDDPTHGSLWFHMASLKPQWDGAIVRTRQIGGHVFYHDGEHLQMAAVSPKPDVTVPTGD
ncbi:cell wall hydrolase [Insolitispirillum peregrinum]|uniref:cell wall hydrolase n=1 Tax=Insolitispirillum peregrinum TaxID=80876 RepID=UPI003613B37F